MVTPVLRSVTPRNVEMGQSLHSGRSMSFIRESCTTQSCNCKGGGNWCGVVSLKFAVFNSGNIYGLVSQYISCNNITSLITYIKKGKINTYRGCRADKINADRITLIYVCLSTGVQEQKLWWNRGQASSIFLWLPHKRKTTSHIKVSSVHFFSSNRQVLL